MSEILIFTTLMINLGIIFLVILFIILKIKYPNTIQKMLNILQDKNINSEKENDSSLLKTKNDTLQKPNIPNNQKNEFFKIKKEDLLNINSSNKNIVKISENQKIYLSEIISQSVDILTHISMLEKGRYSLIFSEKVTKMISNGSLNLMNAIDGGNRAMAVDSTGKIIEHGRIYSANNSAMVLACGSWRVLSIITAQKYLSDINNKLKSIKNDLNNLTKWVQSEEKGEIAGDFDYLNSLVKEIQSSDLLNEDFGVYKSKVEDIIIRSYHKIETNLIRLKNLSDDISAINENSSINDFSEIILNQLDEAKRIHSVLYLIFRNILLSLVIKKVIFEKYTGNSIQDYIFDKFKIIDDTFKTIQYNLKLKTNKIEPSFRESLFTNWENTLRYCHYAVDEFNINNSCNFNELNNVIQDMQLETNKPSDLQLSVNICEKGNFKIEQVLLNS